MEGEKREKNNRAKLEEKLKFPVAGGELHGTIAD
jgi:hypothetical protein